MCMSLPLRSFNKRGEHFSVSWLWMVDNSNAQNLLRQKLTEVALPDYFH